MVLIRPRIIFEKLTVNFRPRKAWPLPASPNWIPPCSPTHSPTLLIPLLTFSALHCFFKNIYLATWGLSFATCAIFSCGMWTPGCSMWDLVPWPGIEAGPPNWDVESQSLDHQVSPYTAFKALMTTVLLLVAMATLHSGDPSKFLPKRMSMQLFSQGENKSYLY